MFNEKRILLFLNHGENMSFQGKRVAFEKPSEAPKGAVESKEKLNDTERQKVIEELQKMTSEFSDWDANKNPLDNFKELSKKIYKDNAAKQEFATKLLDESLGTGSQRQKSLDTLKKQGIKFVRVEDGKLNFYVSKDEKADLPTAFVTIKTPDAGAAKPPEPKVEKVSPEPKKGPTEMSDEQKQAIEFFKKAFPDAKPGDIRIKATESAAAGSKADLYLGYQGAGPVDPDYINEEGKGRSMMPDSLRDGAYVPLEIQKGFIVEAPKKSGVMGKYVLAKLSPNYYAGGKREFLAWVEVGKLRTGEKHEALETQNEWKKEPEYTDEKVTKGTYDSLGNTVLYRGKGPNAGNMVRMIEKGDKVTVESERVRKVGNESYVYVTFEKNGALDHGFVRKDTVYIPTAGPVAQEKAYQDASEVRENADLVAKYYNRSTGIIDFQGDKKAENTITISDLFPNAKAGDKIQIKHKAGGNTMEATYDPDKEYTKWIGGKADKRKGTFTYKNGIRVEIWNGDRIVSASWEEGKAGEAPKDRSVLQEYHLEKDETYQSAAEKALALPAIKNAFEGTKFSEPEKIAAYVKLLKKYQKGNTLYFVVPNPDEAGIPTAQELAEGRYNKRAEEYGNEFKMSREKTEKDFRKNMKQYIDNQVLLDKSLIDIANDKDLWDKAWNGTGTSTIAGLDQLITVLKRSVFAYEGQITPENARHQVLELIQKGKNDRVDFEDVLDAMKIYITKKGEVGDLGDFKAEVEENSKIMKENETGMKAFEAKKGEGILKQTQIVNVIQEKRKLAEAQGDKAANYDSFEKYIWHLVEGDKQQYTDYFKAFKALAEVKNDPDFQQWDKYRLASSRMGYLNYIMEEGARLLQAIGQLKVKEYSASGMASPEAYSTDSGKSIDALADVFHDGEKADWKKDHPNGRSFAWEDVVAGEKEDESDTTKFNKYFDENAPMLRVRSRLNKYTNEKGELDGIERISEADTVKEFNYLMKKGLLRLIAWKHNPAAAAEFINKYTEADKVNLPAKDKDESDETYASRVTPMLTKSVESAFGTLKINGLDDLKVAADSPPALKNKINDQKDLIKMGYYFDTRDEEKGIQRPAEGAESAEVKYSMNPMIRKTQEAFIEKYGNEMDAKKRQEKVDKIQTIFIGGAGVKVDTTKAGGTAVGVGLGTGIDLGDGYTIAIGVGVDNVNNVGGTGPVPVIGVALRKGWKLDKDNRYEIGVSGGVGIGIPTGPSVGVGVDFTWPVSGQLDMKIFAGGSIGILAAGVGGGIGIGQNYEAAQKDLEKKIGGIDTSEIDKETDQNKKFSMIINNPDIGPYFRAPASQFNKMEDQVKVVLDLYTEWRKSVGAEAAKQNSLYPISGGGIFAGFVNGFPVFGPYLTFTVGKTTLVYRRQSEESKGMDKASEAQVQEAMKKDMESKLKGQEIKFKEQIAVAGESGEVGTMADGNIGIRKKNFKIDLAPFKETPSVEKYNEALKPYDMKLVLDAATGLLEFQVFGALGNLQILADPGMKGKGLILKDGKVYLAPGANPELFITREEFFTPFPKGGSPMNTIVTITDTPKRTRSMIADEVVQSGAYLYRKAVKGDAGTAIAPWEIVQAPNTQAGNVMDAAQYEKVKGNLEKFSEKVPGFDETQVKAYEEKISKLPFVINPEPELTPGKVKELKSFSKKFFASHIPQYKQLTTVTEGQSTDSINENRRKLAELIQGDAQKAKPPVGTGENGKLTDLQMNFVMSELMDVSFSELEKAGASPQAKRARFEQNLEWSKNTVLLPFFRNKIKELSKREPPIVITSTAEQLVDLLCKRLLANVKDEELGKPGRKFDDSPDGYGKGWLFSSVAGAVGQGLRGVPGYITQDKYGVLGLHHENLAAPPPEGDLAKVILELESPMDKTNDKTFAESVLAKKMITMEGMWFVLGDTMANQAADGMVKALKGEPVADNAGFQKFKEIVAGIRDTQLKGGNAYIVNMPNGNSFEFRLNTQVADAAHARCGNASFAVKEDIQIFARIKPGGGMIVAAGAQNVATVSPEVTARFIQFGLAGVVVVEVGGKQDNIPPPTKPPPPKIPPPRIPAKPELAPKPAPGVGQKPGTGEGGTIETPGGSTPSGGGGE